ncbi:MAG: helix-turn-helix transcriptional regulator [Verrucomicrobiaceae bacterium]|nr:helix-turn-helix transcriptional regulator [Verrucomicrobiaceae bacterium]
MAKNSYIWEKKTDQELQLWPDGSSECYLSAPFVPAKEINRISKKPLVNYPSNLAQDFLKVRGVLSAGITRHKKSYYQERSGANFHVLLYTCKGSAIISMGRDKIKVKVGDVFVAPAGCAYSVSCAKNGWDIFWFHLGNTESWKSLFNEQAHVEKSKNFSKLQQIVMLYSEEVYASELSPFMLESYASIITEYIKRDFTSNAYVPDAKNLESLLVEMRRTLNSKWSAVGAAKSLNITVKRLNSLCLEMYSETFSKILFRNRMQKAFEMLALGKYTYSEIAFETGYSDAYAFSKAFKLFYGKSPHLFLGNKNISKKDV